ncbi:39S ribosomal protein L47, mitochondrial [Macrosteles quadrilineatus]|uniref:39S ribosomal protein L47, mitochondrial n=1 Tax=Macrosteles quadrilineatus TaxID=74068 RepID=UPI0023E34E13|nr:39S ribosomal protein L47, mitochondrial [Macrosteles quadrilineatus]XP_054271594.1 39S ribosomal protein L47, mitochondrial [Macrosteles quadrilineatus]
MNILRRSCNVFLRLRWEGIVLDSLDKTIISKNLCTPKTSSLRPIHTTGTKCDLMEFFDDEKNWGTEAIKVGRAWKKDELRIKSNSDLHKLWYILLKERNMLMSMEHEHQEAFEPFPNPERLDKVKESMHNLEEVVIERNKAYHELETGETGIVPSKQVINQLGLTHFHRMGEHLIPKYVNKKWREKHVHHDNYKETKVFLALLEEKNKVIESKHRKGLRQHVLGLMRRFPNLDLEAVKEKFPEVDVDKLKDLDKARGHWLP